MGMAKTCDVFGTARNTRRYRVVLESVSDDVPGVDLSDRAVKRWIKATGRALCPTGCEKGEVEKITKKLVELQVIATEDDSDESDDNS